MNFDPNNLPRDDHFYTRYKCQGCGSDRIVEIPPRQRSVDIKLWMETVGRRVSQDHQKCAPTCQAQTFDLLIPIDESGQMGKFPASEGGSEGIGHD